MVRQTGGGSGAGPEGLGTLLRARGEEEGRGREEGQSKEDI